MRRGLSGWEGKGLLFLKKKQQKDFYPFAVEGAWIKVFWFFFSKKNVLPYFKR